MTAPIISDPTPITHPIHLPPLVLFAGAGERDLIHCCQRDSIRIVSAQNEGVRIVPGLSLATKLCAHSLSGL